MTTESLPNGSHKLYHTAQLCHDAIYLIIYQTFLHLYLCFAPFQSVRHLYISTLCIQHFKKFIYYFITLFLL